MIHIILFDRSYSVTQWLNYGELKAQLRRRNSNPQQVTVRLPDVVADSALAWRLANPSSEAVSTRNQLLNEVAPATENFGGSSLGLEKSLLAGSTHLLNTLSASYSTLLSTLHFFFLYDYWRAESIFPVINYLFSLKFPAPYHLCKDFTHLIEQGNLDVIFKDPAFVFFSTSLGLLLAPLYNLFVALTRYATLDTLLFPLWFELKPFIDACSLLKYVPLTFFVVWWLHREFSSLLIDTLPVTGIVPQITPLFHVLELLSKLSMPVLATVCTLGRNGSIDTELLLDYDLDSRFMCIYNFSRNYMGYLYRQERYPRFDTLSARFSFFGGVCDDHIDTT